MNAKQIDLIIEYIDAKLLELSAKNHDDGGSAEAYIAAQIKTELYKTIENL